MTNTTRLFKNGDRVTHVEHGRSGVVTSDQVSEIDTVSVMWDGSPMPIFYPAKNLRLEPHPESGE